MPHGHSDGGTSRVRHAIVTAEIALAIILLAAAGLLARSVRNMHAVRVGFRADHVLTLRVTTDSIVTLAVAAVLISSIGLYGTVSFFVARRMR
jgi:hypothetical protein